MQNCLFVNIFKIALVLFIKAAIKTWLILYCYKSHHTFVYNVSLYRDVSLNYCGHQLLFLCGRK